MMGKTMATWWKGSMKENKPLQFVSTRDIGWFGAQAFLDPEQYAGRGISLAGDELTYEQFNEVFKKVTGEDYLTMYGFLGKGMLLLMSDFNTMFKWLNVEGSGAKIGELRKIYPGLMGFETWIREASSWEVESQLS
jgi:hypothetical protein